MRTKHPDRTRKPMTTKRFRDSSGDRPLPQLTAQNEFFWTSGADGQLRIQECQSCQALIHPPAPICRYCRSPTWVCATYPGKATLVGLHRQPPLRLPRPAAALRGGPGGHRRGSPGSVDHQHRRMRPRRARARAAPSRSRSSRSSDVWLPLFKPAAETKTGDRSAVDEIPPQDFGKLRPPDADQGEVRGPAPRSPASARRGSAAD